MCSRSAPNQRQDAHTQRRQSTRLVGAAVRICWQFFSRKTRASIGEEERKNRRDPMTAGRKL